MSPGAPPWQGRSIASTKLRMLEFSAFLEQPQDPETVSRVHMGILCFVLSAPNVLLITCLPGFGLVKGYGHTHSQDKLD